MKIGARVRVRQRDLFVQFDTQTWLLRWNHVTAVKLNRLLQNLGVKTAPVLNAFKNQEVRRASAQLNIRRAFNRPAIKMRCNLRVISLGDRRNFFCLRECRRTDQSPTE